VAWNVLKRQLVQTRETTCTGSIDLESVDAPLVLSSADGVAQQATPAALEIMQRLSIGGLLPCPLPRDLWRKLQGAALGEAIEWRPTQRSEYVLGCSRYSTKAGYFVLMREVSDKLDALTSQLESRHLEAMARLIAGIAHDLRSSVASIVYDADFLELAGAEMRRETLSLTLKDLALASRRLQLSVDSLLDHAQLGPSVSIPVSLTRVLQRAQGLLRSLYGDRAPRLHIHVGAEAEWVRGNPLTMEQLFANVLSRVAESVALPSNVRISADLELAAAPCSSRTSNVRVQIWNDGTGVPAELADQSLEPFITSRQRAPGPVQTDAKVGAEAMNARLFLEPLSPGVCLTVVFPRNE
jgi:signal transduction histidine kinase